MLDRWTVQLFKNPLELGAKKMQRFGCKPDQITIVAFLFGMGALPALFLHYYWLALFCIVLNRIGDGLDGALARITEPTDAGGYLDIVLDLIFYSSVVLGFALAEPVVNGPAAVVLLFTFIGTGSSFLAFAIMAERRGIENLVLPHKGIYYLTGLAEGTETIVCLVLFCLLPDYFPHLAYGFAVICFITMCTRVVGGYLALR